MAIDYNSTWIGLMGGGVSGSVIGGGSVYQFDLHNMGGSALPVRVLVTGKRVGLVAEANAAHAMLIVTGCKTAQDMEGVTSSGIDWELALGLKGSALVKTGAKLFKSMAADAAASVVNWAAHESAKRMVQWTMDDLGIVKPGRQFNLLPSPLAFGVGAGIFYEWQTMKLLSGNVGWNHISPTWFVDTVSGSVRLQMFDIPEQNGARISLGIGVDEFGFDPYIRWKSKTGGRQVGHRSRFHLNGYVHDGWLFENQGGRGFAGFNLTNLEPIGDLDSGLLTVNSNKNVRKNCELEIYPSVFDFGNYPYWSGSDRLTVKTDASGCFISAKNGATQRS